MIVTLLDTDTGEQRSCDDWDMDVFWWTEGNGSCDCNRSAAFGGEWLHEQHRMQLGLEDDLCMMGRRFLIVDVSGNTEGETREEILETANRAYPDDLVAKWVVLDSAEKG
jgi:hypothetical protein